MEKRGIYIHIPFCERKCLYCSFPSIPRAAWDDALVERYVAAVTKEIEQEEADSAPVDTLYIGGGTPSLLAPGQVSRIIESVRRVYEVRQGCESTIEVNPGTVDGEKLKGFAMAGISRLSIGAQSFNDRRLRALGRIHSSREIYAAFEQAAHAGFSSVSIDLIMGLPAQSLSEWEEEVRSAVALSPSHLSVYHLTVEEGTPFFEQVSSGEIAVPEECESVEMEGLVHEILKSHGFRRYEISNYALPGCECRHNYKYWQGEEYRGFGASACSYRNRWRFSNAGAPLDYVERMEAGESPIVHAERLSLERQMGEFMMMGLRTEEGVSSDRFASRFGRNVKQEYGDVIDSLAADGYIEEKAADSPGHYWVSVPQKHWVIHNEVVKWFVRAGIE